MKDLFKTSVVKSEKGHKVELKIDHQTFKFDEKLSDDGLSSYDYAKWYEKMINIALNRLINNAKKTKI